MSVVNGQLANQTTFNDGFMSRTAPTTSTTAKVGLLDPDVANSGLPINNTQKAINKAFEGVGATGENDTTINDYANQNYIANGDNRKVAVGKLDAQLKATQDDLDAAELVIADHETRISQNETDIADHETRISQNETDIADHETRISQNETDIADHETRISQNETDIADHESRITDLESNDMTIGGNKTFSGNMTIQGDLEVQGTTTFINSQNLEVTDQNILVNKGGTNASAEGAGLDVERPLGNAGIHFDSALTSKFKVGLLTSMYEILVSGVAQVVSGLKDFVSGIKVDTIVESTNDQGVTVESVLIKDGLVAGRNISTDGTTLDGHTITLADHETRITQNETDIADHETRLSAAELTIADHETRLDAAELTIADHETRLDAAELTIADHETRITDLESNDMNIGGNKTFVGDTTLNNVEVEGNLLVGVVDNTQTGTDIELTGITAPVIRLTGALGSVDRIEAPTLSKVICLLNKSGGAITIKNDVGTPAANRILTGTNADVTLANNQVAVAVYDPIGQRWHLSSVGGTSGGGGGGGKQTFEMKLNGAYGGSAAYNNVDGLWVAPSNIQITNVFIYQDTAGSGGQTNLDLKVKPFASGSFTSIFLTTPKVSNTAAPNEWCGVGDTVTGFVAPILTSLPFAVAAKSALRMDLLGAQTGAAAGVGLIVEYEEI